MLLDTAMLYIIR